MNRPIIHSLFLSSTALSGLDDVYRAFSTNDTKWMKRLYVEARDNLRRDECWQDFDTVYRSLYAYNYARSAGNEWLIAPERAEVFDDADLRQGPTLRILMDLCLDSKHPKQFLDEFKVANVIQCRAAVLDYSPLPLATTQFELACVNFVFQYRGFNIDGLSKEDAIEGAKHLRSAFSKDHPEWTDLAAHYHIADYEIAESPR